MAEQKKTDKDVLNVEDLEVEALSDEDLETVAGGSGCSCSCAPGGTGCTGISPTKIGESE